MSVPRSDSEFDALLDYVRKERGFDFTGYKRDGLVRRVCVRMQTLGFSDFGDYLRYLKTHPEQVSPLVDTLLINVTEFFRDPSAWNFVRCQIIPCILNVKNGVEPIRVWSAGCASGEEVYTIAMILAEALGVEALRYGAMIFGTDVDDAALTQARKGAYSAKDVLKVPIELRKKYFQCKEEGRHVVIPELRRSIVFGHHDVIKDLPFAHLDLIVCRNTLIYLNTEARKKVFAHFHFALKPGGYLFLGSAEMPLNHGPFFQPVSPKYRVFAKIPETCTKRFVVRPAEGAVPLSSDKFKVSKSAPPVPVHDPSL